MVVFLRPLGLRLVTGDLGHDVYPGSGPLDGSRRPSGLRKTTNPDNSMAHRTTWLRSDFDAKAEDIVNGENQISRRPSGLRKTTNPDNSLAH